MLPTRPRVVPSGCFWCTARPPHSRGRPERRKILQHGTYGSGSCPSRSDTDCLVAANGGLPASWSGCGRRLGVWCGNGVFRLGLFWSSRLDATSLTCYLCQYKGSIPKRAAPSSRSSGPVCWPLSGAGETFATEEERRTKAWGTLCLSVLPDSRPGRWPAWSSFWWRAETRFRVVWAPWVTRPSMR